MLTLYQRLIFGYVLLLALLLAVGLHDSLSLHHAAALDHQATVPTAKQCRRAPCSPGESTIITTVCTLSGVLITIGFLFSIIRPIRRTAAAARRIGQGELQQRIEWRTRDDLGTIATELNRMAVRLRDLRDTEYGRKQMDQQLSDAVVQSIFEPVIVTDAKGHVLKLNQAASEVLGEAAGGSDGPDQHAGRREDPARGARRGLHAPVHRQRGRSRHAAHEAGRGTAQLSTAHHTHARSRGQIAGSRQRA